MTSTKKIYEFDDIALEELGLTDNDRAANEEFRAIKRVLLKAAFHNGGETKNRIMFTSVNGNEGKTFAAVNLARSISMEQNKTVLLVDANVINPKIDQLLSPTPERGLINYLNGEVEDIQEVMCNTDIDRLKVLPKGVDHFLSNELLASERMEKLLIEFNSRYDDRLVVFDAPPLLGVNEAATLATHMDQLVIVIEEGHTRVRDLMRIRALIPENVQVHYLLNKTLQQSEWHARTPQGKRSVTKKQPRSIDDTAQTGASAFN
jgi:protein-tyrosine kinase